MPQPTQVSFVFDDGFAKSCLRISEIFEARGLIATFAVLADPRGFLDQHPKGDFTLWNELQSRGHSIHPHGYDHSDLSALPHAEAIRNIDDCLNYFSDHLENFDAASTTYHLTYNRSTPEVDAYLLEKVRAIRSCGPEGKPSDGLNCTDGLGKRILTCSWHGPDFCDDHLLEKLHAAEHSHASAFVYMLHGLEDEGWGPIRESGLIRVLDFITQSDSLTYAPLNHITQTLIP